MLTEKLETIQKSLDEIKEKLHAMELKLTRRVDRNSIILSGMLWTIGTVVGGVIIVLIKYVLL